MNLSDLLQNIIFAISTFKIDLGLLLTYPIEYDMRKIQFKFQKSLSFWGFAPGEPQVPPPEFYLWSLDPAGGLPFIILLFYACSPPYPISKCATGGGALV